MESRAEVEVRALIDQAMMRVREPTVGRRTEPEAILRTIADPRNRMPAPNTPERAKRLEQLDRKIRSAFAATRGVPELETVQQARLPAPESFHPLDWRVTIHPDGESLVIGTHLGPIRWVRGQQLKIPAGLDPLAERPLVVYSPDGKYLAFTPLTGGLELCDAAVDRVVARFEPRANLPPDTQRVLAVGFDADMNGVWACQADGEIRSWPLPDQRERPAWKTAWERRNKQFEKLPALRAAAFNSDATRLAVGGWDGQVNLYQTDGTLDHAFPSASTRVESLAWSPRSDLIAVGTQDGVVQLWHTDGKPSYQFSAFAVDVTSVLFSPDGQFLLAGEREGRHMRVWNVATGAPVLAGWYAAGGFARDGRRMAVSGRDAVAFLDLKLPQSIRTLSPHRAAVTRLHWARDSRHLVSIDTAFEICVWNVEHPTPVHRFRHPSDKWYAGNVGFAVSDGGEQLASASFTVAFVLDVKTGKTLREWPGLPAGASNLMAYMGEGKFLLVRVEFDDQLQTTSVAYELDAGDATLKPRVIRDPMHGERGFIDSNLTADRRLYSVVVPRDPEAKCRVEVRETATGRLVTSVPVPREGGRESGGGIMRNGRYLALGSQSGTITVVDIPALEKEVQAFEDSLGPK